MKNIFNVFILLLITGFMSSCEPEKYDIPDIDPTPVFTISETGDNNLDKVNVYQEVPLLIIWNNKGFVQSYSTKDYSNSSTDSTFVFKVTRSEEMTTKAVDGVTDSTYVVDYGYNIDTDIDTKTVSLNIYTINNGDTTNTVTLNNVAVEDTEEYY